MYHKNKTYFIKVLKKIMYLQYMFKVQHTQRPAVKPPAHTKLVISTSQRCLQPTNSHLLQIAVSNATLVAHKPLVSSQRELEANSPSQWRSSLMSAVTCHVPHFTVPTFKLIGFNMYKWTSTRVLRGYEFIFPSVGFPSVNPLQLSLKYSV